MIYDLYLYKAINFLKQVLNKLKKNCLLSLRNRIQVIITWSIYRYFCSLQKMLACFCLLLLLESGIANRKSHFILEIMRKPLYIYKEWNIIIFYIPAIVSWTLFIIMKNTCEFLYSCSNSQVKEKILSQYFWPGLMRLKNM